MWEMRYAKMGVDKDGDTVRIAEVSSREHGEGEADGIHQ